MARLYRYDHPVVPAPVEENNKWSLEWEKKINWILDELDRKKKQAHSDQYPDKRSRKERLQEDAAFHRKFNVWFKELMESKENN